jgi:molecular chaperone Hsp33
VGTDQAIRAMTNDGAFRVIAITTTDLVRGGTTTHGLTHHDACLFGELLTASILVRQTMSPDQRVQIFLRGTQGTAVMADSHPDGLTRGLWAQEDAGQEPIVFGDDTQLQVIRVLHNHELHQGFISTRAGGDVSQAVTDYMLSSEQISTRVQIAAVTDENGSVRLAGGYIVQLLPEATEELTLSLKQHLQTLDPVADMLVAADGDAEKLLCSILAPYENTVLEVRSPFHGCNCSESRILSAMSTIGKESLEELVAEGGFLPIRCDYCTETYQIGTEQVRALLVQT